MKKPTFCHLQVISDLAGWVLIGLTILKPYFFVGKVCVYMHVLDCVWVSKLASGIVNDLAIATHQLFHFYMLIDIILMATQRTTNR